jgi:hypothetical protein
VILPSLRVVVKTNEEIVEPVVLAALINEKGIRFRKNGFFHKKQREYVKHFRVVGGDIRSKKIFEFEYRIFGRERETVFGWKGAPHGN